MKKKIIWRGEKVTIEEVPTNPKILENIKQGCPYIPEQERVYIRGREWAINGSQ